MKRERFITGVKIFFLQRIPTRQYDLVWWVGFRVSVGVSVDSWSWERSNGTYNVLVRKIHCMVFVVGCEHGSNDLV